MIDTSTKRAIVYYREPQDSNMTNAQIINQVNQVKEFCNQNDWRTVNTFIDKGSSGSMLNKMIDYATDPTNSISVIVCFKASHISHSLKSFMVLIEDILAPKGISFVSVTEQFDTGSFAGALLLKMVRDLSEFDENIVIQEGRTDRAKSNKFVGGVPYGYIVDGGGAFTVDANKAAVVTEIFKSRAEGDSLQRITDSLNKKGIKTSRGGDFTKQGISFILKNRAYTGENQYNGGNEHGAIIYKIPRIVSKQLFNKANGRD